MLKRNHYIYDIESKRFHLLLIKFGNKGEILLVYT